MTNQLTQRVPIVWLLGIVALAPLGMGADGCGSHAVVGAECRQDAGPDSPLCACERNGKDFAGGKAFPAGDGCNMCACRPDGSTRCTDSICDNDSSDGGGGHGGAGGHDDAPAGCDYDGEHHPDGEGFPATDGCNTCKCTPSGVACTEIACGGAKTCGGLLGASCGDEEYCNFPPDAACGAADATGTCETKPAACTREYKPVCGCDGKTYGNACTAASSGVSVLSQHECMQP